MDTMAVGKSRQLHNALRPEYRAIISEEDATSVRSRICIL